MSVAVEYTKDLGDCYESAVNSFMGNRWTEFGLPDKRDAWTLVHTMCAGGGTIEGVRFGHAFLLNREMGLVIDIANGRGGLLPAPRYFKLGDVDPDKYPFYEYTYAEMLEELVEHETYGPWGDAFDEIAAIEDGSVKAAGLSLSKRNTK